MAQTIGTEPWEIPIPEPSDAADIVQALSWAYLGGTVGATNVDGISTKLQNLNSSISDITATLAGAEGGGSLTLLDDNFKLKSSNNEIMNFDVAGPGTMVFPAASGTVVLTSAAQELQSKTLLSPVITSGATVGGGINFGNAAGYRANLGSLYLSGLTAGSFTTIDTVSIAAAKTMEYYCVFTSAAGNMALSTRFFLVHNDSQVHATEYVTVSTSDSFTVSIDAEISGGNILVKVNPSHESAVAVSRISVGAQGLQGPNDNTSEPLVIEGPAGPAGPAGPTGADGADGLPGEDGTLLAAWRGAWEAGTTYSPGDAANYDGSAWVALTESIGALPSATPVTAEVGRSALQQNVHTGITLYQPFTVSDTALILQVASTGSSNGALVGPTGQVLATYAPAGVNTPSTLSVPVTLSPGVTYYIRAATMSGDYAAPALSGIVASASIARQSTYDGYPWGARVPFALYAAVTAWSLVASKGDTGSQGPTGPAGPAGADGAAGPTGANGTFLESWQGAWDSGATYTAGDIVSYNGSSWLALTTSTATTPDGSTTYTLLGQSNPTINSYSSQETSQRFQVSSPVTVTHVAIIAHSSAGVSAGATIGIATSNPTGSSNPALAASGTVAAFVASGEVIIELDTPIDLSAGVNYWLVTKSGGNPGLKASSITPSGVVTSLENGNYYGPTYSTYMDSYWIVFKLYSAYTPWDVVASGGSGGSIDGRFAFMLMGA